jgi:hypothetical protein
MIRSRSLRYIQGSSETQLQRLTGNYHTNTLKQYYNAYLHRTDSLCEHFMQWELTERKTQKRHNATRFQRRLQ